MRQRDAAREAKYARQIALWIDYFAGRIASGSHAAPPFPKPLHPHPGCCVRLCPLCAARRAS